MDTKDTEILLQEIKEATNIYSYIQKNNDQLGTPSFSEYLNTLIKRKKIKKSHLIFMSGLSRQYAYEVFNGTKKPSRIKVLSIAFTLAPTLDELQRMLTYANHRPLYAKDPFDAILIYGIQQKMSLIEINDILYELNHEVIE